MSNMETAKPEWIVEAIKARTQQRREAWNKRENVAATLKEKGNEFFKNGQYREAVSTYTKATENDYTKPMYFSNLSAALLKLEEYETAVQKSTIALVLDPTHKKARFRRLQARKALGFHVGALSDARAIIRQASQDDATLPEVRLEIRELESLVDKRPADLRSYNTIDSDLESDPEDDWPNEAQAHGYVFDPELHFSDSEDNAHKGNGIPCRYYNRPHGCRNGEKCRFSHAPDDMSERDLMGKNVCNYYLLGRCRFEDDKCNYSHDDNALPTEGWWTTASGRQKVSASMKGKARKAGKKIRKSKGRQDLLTQDMLFALIGKGMKTSKRRQNNYGDHDDDFNDSSDEGDTAGTLRRAAGIFTEDEEYELLCQGVKPWEEDAANVLGALYGGLR